MADNEARDDVVSGAERQGIVDQQDAARDGYEALMAGKDHVVAGSAKNKAQVVVAAKVLPDTLTAAVHGAMSRPGSGGR